jgi:hypothetical protein
VDEIKDFTQFDQNVELLKKGKQAEFANPVVNALLYVSLTICYVKQLMTKHYSSYFQTVLLKRLRFLGRARDFLLFRAPRLALASNQSLTQWAPRVNRQ